MEDIVHLLWRIGRWTHPIISQKTMFFNSLLSSYTRFYNLPQILATLKRILVDSLNTGRILGQYELFAFVIMPNHVHLIIRCLNRYTPVDVVREFKKATANLILRQYEAESNHEVLAFFASAVKPGQKQQHAVWEDEYQAKNIFSPAFLRQKLDYIHHNPVQPHWRLVEQSEQYVWSSARFYLAGGRALIPLSDARELLV